MNRNDIIRMAQESGFDPHDMSDDFTCNLMDIERFAKLVAAAEREACALAAEAVVPRHTECGNKIAAAIRARG